MRPGPLFEIEEASLARLRRVFARLRDLANRKLYVKVGKRIVEQTLRRFESKTDPEGKPWKRWSPNYTAPKHASHTLLKDTHTLHKAVAQNARDKFLIRDNTLVIGVDVAYAAPVQAARPFFGMGPADSREVMDLIEQQAIEAISGH